VEEGKNPLHEPKTLGNKGGTSLDVGKHKKELLANSPQPNLKHCRGDERTILIGLHASRVTWIFLSIVLLIWTFQGLISTGQLGVQAVALFISQAVFWSSYLYY